MSDLYDDDILLWSERQAKLLRRRAAGELVNDAELDWPNIAEEIEDVGRSRVPAVASHLILALLHDLKAEAWPRSLSESKLAGGGAGYTDGLREEASRTAWRAEDQPCRPLRPSARRPAGGTGRNMRRCPCRRPARSRLTSCWHRHRRPHDGPSGEPTGCGARGIARRVGGAARPARLPFPQHRPGARGDGPAR